MKIEIEGIVIRQNAYKEKDAMISVITKDGIVSFLAKNILTLSSKNRSACMPFSYSIFTLNSRLDKLTLTQSKLLKSYVHLYSSLSSLTSINLVIECINKFVDEDNNVIYHYLKNYLELLNNNFSETTLTLIILAQIIKSSGYNLEYNSCVKCGSKKDIVDVSYLEGGYLCLKCSKNRNISQEYLKTFRYVFMINPSQMDHHIVNEIIGDKMIEDFCNYLITSFGFKELKALEMYKMNKKQ